MFFSLGIRFLTSSGSASQSLLPSEESNGDVDLCYIIFRRRVLGNKGVCSGKLKL